MKIIEAVVKKTLAQSPKLTNLFKVANETALDLGRLAVDVISLARGLATLGQMVHRHELMLHDILSNQRQIAKLTQDHGSDVSMPPIKPNAKAGKPN